MVDLAGFAAAASQGTGHPMKDSESRFTLVRTGLYRDGDRWTSQKSGA